MTAINSELVELRRKIAEEPPADARAWRRMLVDHREPAAVDYVIGHSPYATRLELTMAAQYAADPDTPGTNLYQLPLGTSVYVGLMYALHHHITERDDWRVEHFAHGQLGGMEEGRPRENIDARLVVSAVYDDVQIEFNAVSGTTVTAPEYGAMTTPPPRWAGPGRELMVMTWDAALMLTLDREPTKALHVGRILHTYESANPYGILTYGSEPLPPAESGCPESEIPSTQPRAEE